MTRYSLFSNPNTGKHLFVREFADGKGECVSFKESPGACGPLQYHHLIRARVEETGSTEGLRMELMEALLNVTFQNNNVQEK